MKNKRKPKMRRGRYTTRLLFFFVLILLGMTGLFRQESAPERFGPYAVERVIDGDTIVADVDGRSETIRLIGVDAPESVHPDRSRNTAEGKKAAEYVRSLLEDQRKIYIEYDASERDRYHRVLAYVYLQDGKTMLNEHLLKEGYAAVMTVQPNTRYADDFYKLQRKAREEKKGIWSSK